MYTHKTETEKKELFLDAIELTDAEMAEVSGAGDGDDRREEDERRDEDFNHQNIINNINIIAASNGWGGWF